AAQISGNGTIRFYNPSDAMAASSATYIDGNNVIIDVNIELLNASNLFLTDMIYTGPDMTWSDRADTASLGVGRDFSLMVDGGDVILGMVFSDPSSTCVAVENTAMTTTDFIFDNDATISHFRPERMVVTSNSIQGHLVK